jgi:hypothetical protein
VNIFIEASYCLLTDPFSTFVYFSYNQDLSYDNVKIKHADDVGNLTRRPSFTSGKTPGSHFCWMLNRPQARSAAGRFRSLGKSNDLIERAFICVYVESS